MKQKMTTADQVRETAVLVVNQKGFLGFEELFSEVQKKMGMSLRKDFFLNNIRQEKRIDFTKRNDDFVLFPAKVLSLAMAAAKRRGLKLAA